VSRVRPFGAEEVEVAVVKPVRAAMAARGDLRADAVEM